MTTAKGAKKSSSGRKTGEHSRAGASGRKVSKGKSRAAGYGVKGWSKLKKTDWKTAKIADFYRPLKKPITLRLDADVIAWFKNGGRRYQTRINSALRSMMVKERNKR
jgi:uncharacterized protein (DUF4415 family)